MDLIYSFFLALILSLSPASTQNHVGKVKTLGPVTIPAPTAALGNPFITAQSLGTSRNDFTGCVGLLFTAPSSSPPTITQLGRWVISGNSGAHTVHLFDTTFGGETANASVNTSLGTPGTYKYTAITPTTLIASHVYFLASSETASGDAWYDQDTTVTTDSAFGTMVSAAYNSDCTFAYTSGTSGNFSFVPPNMTR